MTSRLDAERVAAEMGAPDEVEALCAQLDHCALSIGYGPGTEHTLSALRDAAAMIRRMSGRVKQLENGYDTLRTALHRAERDLAAARERIAALEGALRELLAALDYSASEQDDVAAMLRYGDAEKTARALAATKG